MNRDLLNGNEAAAWGARLARVDYIPAYPMAPQSEIVENLLLWAGRGEISARVVTMNSEHSLIIAAAEAAATGARAFAATPNQGLLYGLETLYTVAEWRVPLVLVNVSRTAAMPLAPEPDHNDILAARDSGWLQLHAETCQEVFDCVLMAYRLAEHGDVRLPAIVNFDGIHLSSTRQLVELPPIEAVHEFLPSYCPHRPPVATSDSLAQSVAALGSSAYGFLKYQMQRAAESALDVHDHVASEFCARFGRCYGAVETYRLDDAEFVLVMSNSFSTAGKAAVDRLRAGGDKVGLLRLRLLRPFPQQEIAWLLNGRRAVAVIDHNISVGKGGILFSEVASALVGSPMPPLVSYIGGLGGRRFQDADFDVVMSGLHTAEHNGAAPEPHLLYSAAEFERIRELLGVAHGSEAG